MPRYKIGWDAGYAGGPEEEIIEADSLEEAEEIAWQEALNHISAWAEEIEDEEDE